MTKRIKVKPLGGSLLNFGRQFFRNRDSYGQSVSLNYKGEDTFTTCPGGFLSLLLSLFIYGYMLL